MGDLPESNLYYVGSPLIYNNACMKLTGVPTVRYKTPNTKYIKRMRFIKFAIVSLFLIVAYLAHILSKLDANHVHEISLTFIAIGSMLAGGVSLLGSLKEDKSNIIESNDDASI